MFDKILIANRGEIAVRIIRACRALGVRSVAVYSEADREALHTRLADEAVECGGARASDSYLDAERLVELALEVGADAVHPGYGFLSENAAFAERCAKHGIVFIGPSPHVLRTMGDKISARRAMSDAGVPVVPGSLAELGDEEAKQAALEIGLPVMVKASAGGGGRGLRLVREEAELDEAIARARSEAKSAFGDDTLYVEKFLSGPRHIEVQILADTAGHAIHLHDRECSIQRRHQKLIEEAPATRLPQATRDGLHAAAVRAAQAVGYVGAGTVEFLVDDRDDYHFLEMNTRIQVEHAITEEVTGVDLVAEMIRISAGEPLSIEQGDVVVRGHAIEARVYAEDPDRGFMPSPGTLRIFRPPAGPGIRVDAGVEEGGEVSVHYDPMIAKLVVFGATRDLALARLRSALLEFRIGGIRTSLPFHLRALEHPDFVAGRYDTGFVEERLGPPPAASEVGWSLAARVAALELAAAGVVAAGSVIEVRTKGIGEVAIAAMIDEAGTRVRVGDEEHVLDARRLAPGLWSILEGASCHECVVDLRGKTAVEVVVAGRRHALKWKQA